MTSAPRPPARALRAATVAAVAVALGVAGHLVAGGHVAHPLVLAGVGAALAAVAWVAAARELRSGVLVGALGFGQIAVHLAGVVAAMDAQGAAAAAHHHLAHHLAGGETAAGGAVAGRLLAMVAAHLAATAAAVWWMRRGERALWALVRVVRRAVAAVRAFSGARRPAAPAPRVAAVAAGAAAPVAAWLVRAAPRRGPPATVGA